MTNYGDIVFGGGNDPEDALLQPRLGLIGRGRVDNYGTIAATIAIARGPSTSSGEFYNYCEAPSEFLGDQFDYSKGRR